MDAGFNIPSETLFNLWLVVSAVDIERILKRKKREIDREIEKVIPKRLNKNDLDRLFGEQRYAKNAKAANFAFPKPIWDLLERGGKRWRPVLFLLILEALGKNPREFIKFAPIVEIIHNGTLMVDDIEDNSDLRRGKPCVHRKFGVDVAINAGNAMYFFPMKVISKSYLSPETKNRLYGIYIEEMTNCHLGQGTDIFWHSGKADDIEEREYLQMCAFKTGTLARMSAKFAAVLAEASEEIVDRLGRCAESIGVGFQIFDDILNITPTEKWGKEFGEDIKEGKRSLMVIHTLENATRAERKRLLEILDSHPSDRKLMEEAIGMIRRYGSIDYARKRAVEIVRSSWMEAEPFLLEGKAKESIAALVDYLVNRKF